jgi:hypothetical protein
MKVSRKLENGKVQKNANKVVQSLKNNKDKG